MLKTIAGVVMSLTLTCAAVPVTTASAATITFLQGDVDGNGAIGIADLTMISRFLNGNFSVTSEQLTRMDTVQNKVIEKQDYNKIRNFNIGVDVAQTVSSEVYTNHSYDTRTYYVYDCELGSEVGTYTLMATPHKSHIIMPEYGIYAVLP